MWFFDSFLAMKLLVVVALCLTCVLATIEDDDLNGYEYNQEEQDPTLGLKLGKVLLAKKLLLGGVLGLPYGRSGYGYGPYRYIRPGAIPGVRPGVIPGVRPGGRPGIRPIRPPKPYYDEEEQDPTRKLKLRKLLRKKLLLRGVLGLPFWRYGTYPYGRLGYGYGPYGYVRPGVSPGLRPGGRPGVRPARLIKPFYDEEEYEEWLK